MNFCVRWTACAMEAMGASEKIDAEGTKRRCSCKGGRPARHLRELAVIDPLQMASGLCSVRRLRFPSALRGSLSLSNRRGWPGAGGLAQFCSLSMLHINVDQEKIEWSCAGYGAYCHAKIGRSGLYIKIWLTKAGKESIIVKRYTGGKKLTFAAGPNFE